MTSQARPPRRKLAAARAHQASRADRRGATASPAAVLRLLRAQGLTVAVAESCSGGLLCAALTSVPGSSANFLGGVVAYANSAKERALGVPADVLGKEGAVSRAAALALAQGARSAFAADVGVGVTGIAGPGGARPGKPVGTVWIALAGPGRLRIAQGHRFPGSRASVRRQTVRAALALMATQLAARARTKARPNSSRPGRE